MTPCQSELAMFIARAKEIGVSPDVFKPHLHGMVAKWSMSERARLFWSLRDSGWSDRRIARAAGYNRNTIADVMRRLVRPDVVAFDSAKVAAQKITDEVSTQTGLAREYIWERSETERLRITGNRVHARHAIWHEMRQRGYSLMEIARATLGTDNHASIANAMRSRAKRLRTSRGTSTHTARQPAMSE